MSPKWLGLAFLLAAPVIYGQIAVSEVRVQGNSRLPAAGIIGASGLRAGSNIAKPDLDAAAQKLFETGLFTAVNYRYDPNSRSPGFIVTLVVTEDRAATAVVLDVPGFPEAQLWEDLKRANPLIDTVIPDSDAATNYYSRNIESVLAKANHAEAIVMRPEADLRTRRTEDIFQPANLPKVAAIRFEGNQAISGEVLGKTLEHLTTGQDFSERAFANVVRFNLTPLYEEKGLLTVNFPPLKYTENGGAVSVTVPIEEGRVWNLGSVNVTGEGIASDEMLRTAHFPEGKLANWKQVQASIDAMDKMLKRQGYLAAVLTPTRAFREGAGAVDLAVAIAKGRQFLFGSFEVAGLDPENQRVAMAAWKLRMGEPLDYYYVYADYPQALKLAGPPKKIQAELHPRAGTNTVDVTITFR